MFKKLMTSIIIDSTRKLIKYNNCYLGKSNSNFFKTGTKN